MNVRFDLGHARSARLNMNVGANGANAWSLLVCKDDKVYVTEASGKCWPAWQSVALDKYLAEQGRSSKDDLREGSGDGLPGP